MPTLGKYYTGFSSYMKYMPPDFGRYPLFSTRKGIRTVEWGGTSSFWL
jgi:hypothetical protein